MRVLLVTPELVSEACCDGGLANFVRRFARALAEAGHSPVVVGPGDPEEGSEEPYPVHRVRVALTPSERWLDRLSLRRLSMTIALRRQALSLAQKVREVVAAEPVEVVQYGHLGGAGWFRPLTVPVVIRLSSSTALCRENGGYDNQSSFAMWQLRRFERKAMLAADGLFCPGRVVADAVAAELARPVEVLESVFFLETRTSDEEVLRSRLGDADYLLFVGRLNVLKGVTAIAEILAEVLARHPGLRFAFAGREHAGYGGRTMAEHLLASAGEHRDRVVLLGQLPHAQLYPVMARAKAVVLPSLFDNFANVGLEAMTHRRVVVATRGTSFEQMIVDGDSGFLCPRGDPAALLVAVEKALALTPGEAATIGDRAAASVDRWRPERMVPRYVDYYRRVVEEFQARRRASLPG